MGRKRKNEVEKSEPGPERPYCLPRDERWDRVPEGVKEAAEEIPAPAYRELVENAQSELERLAGLLRTGPSNGPGQLENGDSVDQNRSRKAENMDTHQAEQHAQGTLGPERLENRESVDQNTHRALRLIDERPEIFGRQGSVAAAWRTYRGRKLGPYFRLAYREAGRQCSVYLGRAGRVVEAVRERLAELQRPLKRHRKYLKARAQIKASLGPVKRELDRRLRRVGLRLQGFEVRGWRASSLTSFARRCLQKKWGRPFVQAAWPTPQGRASPARFFNDRSFTKLCETVENPFS